MGINWVPITLYPPFSQWDQGSSEHPRMDLFCGNWRKCHGGLEGDVFSTAKTGTLREICLIDIDIIERLKTFSFWSFPWAPCPKLHSSEQCILTAILWKLEPFIQFSHNQPIGSMGLVYLPTFAININHLCDKCTIVPWRWCKVSN